MTNNLKLKFIKTGLAIGAQVTPNQVMKYMWNKLFTARKRPLKSLHQAVLEQANTGYLTATLFNDETLELVTYTWGEGSKTVLLLHGWESKAVDYYQLIPQLLVRGYRVVSVDFPAHGNSPGKQSSLPEFIKVIHQFLQQEPLVEAIIAHSLGGTAALTWLLEQAQDTYPVKKLIMIGSPIVPKKFFEGVFNFLNIRQRVRKLFYDRARNKFGKGIEDFTLQTLDNSITHAQIYGLYDATDRIVGVEDMKAYQKANHQLQVQYFQGIGHHHLIKDKEIINACIDILTQD